MFQETNESKYLKVGMYLKFVSSIPSEVEIFAWSWETHRQSCFFPFFSRVKFEFKRQMKVSIWKLVCTWYLSLRFRLRCNFLPDLEEHIGSHNSSHFFQELSLISRDERENFSFFFFESWFKIKRQTRQVFDS